MKHGLTGEGVALPSEDQVEISRRFGALGDEFQATTESGRLLVRRFAFLSVRLERCERHETAILPNRVRHAESEFDDQRMAEIELHASNLIRAPMTSSQRLQSVPEGIDWLVEYWLEPRGDLMIEDRVVWTWNHWARCEMLMGNPEGNTRVRALTEAVSGFFANLDPTDGEGLDDMARAKWARDEIAAMIDTEVARLKEVRNSLDHEAIERDRAEAADRALFDASPEMVLARRYEVATERAMYRALKEFREAEKAASEPNQTDVSNFREATCVSMASSEQISEPESPEADGFRVPRAGRCRRALRRPRFRSWRSPKTKKRRSNSPETAPVDR